MSDDHYEHDAVQDSQFESESSMPDTKIVHWRAVPKATWRRGSCPGSLLVRLRRVTCWSKHASVSAGFRAGMKIP